MQKGIEDITYKLICKHKLKEAEEEKSLFVYEFVDEIYKQSCEYTFLMEQC
jgi:hypothetical protein